MKTMEDIFRTIGQWDSPADELIKLGIKGDRDECERCPMANYIISEAPPNVHSIYVDNKFTRVRYDNQFGDEEHIPNPGNMTQFIEAFDSCKYPELDTNPPQDEDDWEDDYCPCCGPEEDPWI